MKKEELKIGEIYYLKMLDDSLELIRLTTIRKPETVNLSDYALVDVHLLISGTDDTVSSVQLRKARKTADGSYESLEKNRFKA